MLQKLTFNNPKASHLYNVPRWHHEGYPHVTCNCLVWQVVVRVHNSNLKMERGKGGANYDCNDAWVTQKND